MVSFGNRKNTISVLDDFPKNRYQIDMSILRDLRNKKGLSQAALADLAGTTQPQIKRLETAGKAGRKLTRQWAERLAPHLDTDAATLMFGDEDLIPPSNAQPVHAHIGEFPRVPVYGQAIGGDDGYFILNGHHFDDIVAPPSLAGVAGAYAVYVVGESMEPRYFAGEAVFVHPRLPVSRGDFVVAQIKIDGEKHGYVKRFMNLNEDRLLLEQYNPQKKIEFPRNKVISIHKIVMGGQR